MDTETPPLPFALSPAHEAYRERVRAFAESEIAPNSKRWDAENRIPWPAVRAMGEAGLLGVIAPEHLGGEGRDYVSLGIAVEELARAEAEVLQDEIAKARLDLLPQTPFCATCAGRT